MVHHVYHVADLPELARSARSADTRGVAFVMTSDSALRTRIASHNRCQFVTTLRVKFYAFLKWTDDEYYLKKWLNISFLICCPF